MKRDLGPISVELDRLIERQMRNWELARQQRLEQEAAAAKQVEDFITISRAVGLDVTPVTQILNERLGWPVFDRELLSAMALDDAYRRRLYANLDERDMSWIEECVMAMAGEETVPNDYFRRLRETILSLARKGPSIFVGRGADLLLPKDAGLRVRLTADRTSCIRHYAESHGVSHDEAARQVATIEEERDKFFRHHFRQGFDVPSRYDLVVNVERFTPAQTAELILAAGRMRGWRF